MDRTDYQHMDMKIDKILENQSDHGARLVRLETLTEEMREDVQNVTIKQDECPGRVAEMERMARRKFLNLSGKVLAWSVGIGATTAGAVKAIATLVGD